MRNKLLMFLAAMALTACSGAPSDSEMKEAILQMSGIAPQSLDCSAKDSGTTTGGLKYWDMECDTEQAGQSATVRVRAMRRADGSLRLSM